MITPTKLLKASLLTFKNYFWYLLKLWLIGAAVIFIGSFSISLLSITLIVSSGVNPYSFILPIIGLITFVIGIVWFQSALYVQYFHISQNKRLPYKQIFREGWHYAGSIFLLRLISGILILIGLLLLIIPGVIFSVWFSFVIPSLLAHKSDIFAAFSKSKAIASKHFFTIIKYWLIFSFYCIAAVVVVTILGKILSLSETSIDILTSIVSIPFGSIGLIYFYKLYHELSKK